MSYIARTQYDQPKNVWVYLLGSIYKTYIGREPTWQPYTTWVSEDGNITIKIDSGGEGSGTIVADEDTIPFYYAAAGPTLYLYKSEAADSPAIYQEWQYECWVGSFRYYDRFTVTVEETTFFEVGDKITFYRVDS